MAEEGNPQRRLNPGKFFLSVNICGKFTVPIGYVYIGVSKNRGTPKSSILIGFSIINHPFWGTSIFGNTHILYIYICL